MNTEKSYSASRYRKLDRMVARLKEILQCIICLEIVGCPAVQCEAGHLMCGRCRDNLRENTCPTCRQPLIDVRNKAVEQVVEALPEKCPNVDYGCQELLIADEVDTHRVTCPFHQFSCPHPPCPWAGSKPEIISHMRDTHPKHVLSSNRQTVKVPVKWGEVSSWAMFLDDVILILKFSVDRVTKFLLGSFECLGQLEPVNSITYHMTVKRGDRETTLSGSIAPERSARQSVEDWDNVFPRSRYDDHPESEASTSGRYINVDVSVEDKRRLAVAQASVDVEVQTQGSDDVEGGVGDEAGGDTTQQVGGGNHSDQTADRVIHKLGSWLESGFYDLDNYTSSMSEIHQIMKETNKNIISSLVKSIDDINEEINCNNFYRNYICVEIYLYHLSRDLAETNIKMERARAAGGRHFRHEWMFAYLLIVEQAVHQSFSKYVSESPVFDMKLDKLLTARDRRLRDKSTLRMLRCVHASGGEGGVKNIIGHMGRVYKKSKEEISGLTSAAATVPWNQITPSS